MANVEIDLSPQQIRSPIRNPIFIDFYYDSEFPHAYFCLHNLSLKSTKEEIMQICQRSVWKKPYEILGTHDIQLFSDIKPKCILQGPLADCYFLASISSMAKNPERIQKMFDNRGVSPNGCYTVFGYDCGIKKEIVVDDFLIFDPLVNDLAFSKVYGKQIWVQLLEKAWAKYNGSFTNIEFGEEIEALEFLTGAPVDCYVHNSLRISLPELWGKITEANSKRYIITTSTKKEQSSDSIKKAGLMPFHVYSILDAKEFIFPYYGESSIKLLLIRDQWQKSHYKSPKGNDNLTKFFGEFIDPNCFAITFEEYLEFFKETTICKYEDSFKHSHAEISTAENVMHLFEIQRTTKGFLSIHQKHFRQFRLKDKNYSYAPIYAILGRLDCGRIKYVTSFVTSVLNSEHREIELPPGKYVIMTGGEFENIAKYTIHFYAEEEISMTPEKFDMRFMISLATDYSEQNKSQWKKLTKGLSHFEKINWGFGFGISFVKNTLLAKEICYEENMKFTGMEQIFPEHENGRMKGTLEPGESMISLYKFNSTKGFSYIVF